MNTQPNDLRAELASVLDAVTNAAWSASRRTIGTPGERKRAMRLDIEAALSGHLTALTSHGGGGEAVAVPSGWKLAPIEPTWDMRNEGREFLIDGMEKEPEKLAYFLWKTMIAAAPEQF